MSAINDGARFTQTAQRAILHRQTKICIRPARRTKRQMNSERDTSISFDFSESNETKRNTKTNRTDVVQCDDIHTTGRL